MVRVQQDYAPRLFYLNRSDTSIPSAFVLFMHTEFGGFFMLHRSDVLISSFSFVSNLVFQIIHQVLPVLANLFLYFNMDLRVSQTI
jgi:hypothetical protein